jgi:hypothetical protein
MAESAQISPTIIGFREWVSLSELRLHAIKAKVDTGAKTSSLHAYDIRLVKREGVTFVKFKVHPLQRDSSVVTICSSPLVDRRIVTDSGGHKEERYVIETTIQMGSRVAKIELTLTNRESMKYRMLIGREALRNFYIDAGESYLLGKTPRQRRYLKNLFLKLETNA